MPIYIKSDKDNVFVEFEFSEERVNKIKQIKGRQWDAQARHWVLPNTEKNIEQLKIIFKNEDIVFNKILFSNKTRISLIRNDGVKNILIMLEKELN